MPAETLRQAQGRCSWRAKTAKRIPSPIRGLRGETRLSTGSIFTDQLFTGQREMTGLGIYHFNARFYSPKLGRFLSADTIVPNPANPQDLNRYSYVRNNPLRYTDPSGNRPCGDGEKYDCDGRLNPITPSKPPVVIITPKPTNTPTKTPTSTVTPTPTLIATPTQTSASCSSPTSDCATQLASQATIIAYQCQSGMTCIGSYSTPTVFPTLTPFMYGPVNTAVSVLVIEPIELNQGPGAPGWEPFFGPIGLAVDFLQSLPEVIAELNYVHRTHWDSSYVPPPSATPYISNPPIPIAAPTAPTP